MVWFDDYDGANGSCSSMVGFFPFLLAFPNSKLVVERRILNRVQYVRRLFLY
jgi:hypothetical protein